MRREISLGRIRSDREPFDLLVIGGGATGLGTAVDAAARGYRVALIEQADFAKGTSSRSTKLIHGGIRYLKQGDVVLVREALRERGYLARNASHLVRELAFVIPSYGVWERLLYAAGLQIYDCLGGKLGAGSSRMLNRAETIALAPTIRTPGLAGGVVYRDCQFDDARLAINLAQTAETLGASVLNYCACTGLLKVADKVTGAYATDIETQENFAIRARVVINATGVYVDSVRQFDDLNAPRLVAVSQGIHLVLPKGFLPGRTALLIPKTADGRILFAVPWHDRVIVGTTDTNLAASMPMLEPRAFAAERDFIMQQARKFLAEGLADSDVLSVFAGLRPLLRSSARNTAALSRHHAVVVSRSGLITVAGGKWTTYRKMAEDVVDCAEGLLGDGRRRCRSAHLPIHGSESGPSQSVNLQSYGSDGALIETLLRADPGLAKPLHPLLPYQVGEVVWHACQEMARTVEDVLARRTRALLLDARASIEAAPTVARILARELGREAAWAQAQVQAYSTLARGYIFTDPASVARAA